MVPLACAALLIALALGSSGCSAQPTLPPPKPGSESLHLDAESGSSRLEIVPSASYWLIEPPNGRSQKVPFPAERNGRYEATVPPEPEWFEGSDDRWFEISAVVSYRFDGGVGVLVPRGCASPASHVKPLVWHATVAETVHFVLSEADVDGGTSLPSARTVCALS
jgi:hypothetical protein